MTDEKILIGIDEIKKVIGNVTYVTILKWKKEYPTMPIKKIGGQWTSMRSQLVLWWNAYVSDSLGKYESEKGIQKVPVNHNIDSKNYKYIKDKRK